MRSRFRCNRGAAQIATAEDGVFEDFTVDVGRIRGGSQRYGNGGGANRGGGTIDSGRTVGSRSTVGAGSAEAWSSAAVADSGTADEGRSLSACESEVLYGFYADSGYGQCIFEGAMGI